MGMKRSRICLLALIGCLMIGPAAPGGADESLDPDEEYQEVAHLVSRSNNPIIGGTTVGLWIAGGTRGRRMANEILSAQLVNQSITESLKWVTQERRPNGGDTRSFPSGHTSSAFALAHVLAQHDRRSRWWYYGGAALIGWSRVELETHYWWDAAAGAAIGVASAHMARSGSLGLTALRIQQGDLALSIGPGLHPRGIVLVRASW